VTALAAPVDRGLLVRALALFWSGLTVLFMVRSITEPWASRFASLGRRLPEALFGAALCWLMYLVLRRVAAGSIARRLAWAVALSLPLGGLFSLFNAAALYASSLLTVEGCGDGRPCSVAVVRNLAVEYSVNFTFVFLAWGAVYLGMQATAEALAAERRLSAARDAARVAELRALRYQVDPHFLFNCLNSLGTLIDRGDGSAARAMVGEMGSFLRYGLAIDPLADVELEDEVEMQRRYLEIERRRFAHRLAVAIEIDPAVRHARLPSLLLQPLVENAVKHGVSSTSAPVRVAIRALRDADGRVVVTIEDDAPAARTLPATRAGIGLRNVEERLEARFDGAARLTVGPRREGGYRATIVMPLVTR
jgi:hypothetical protein